MIRFARPVAPLVLGLAVIVGCRGAATVTPRPAEPTATQVVATVEPNPTPGVTVQTPAAPTDSSGLMAPAAAWPTTVTLTMNSGRFVGEYAQGTFSSTRAARNCENTVLLPRGFLFGFPRDLLGGDVEDVSFGADELLPGSSTSSFRINVSIAPAAAGGPHPLTALNTDDPTAGASGSAQLSVAADGTRTLVVDVADKDGVSVHLNAVCSPA